MSPPPPPPRGEGRGGGGLQHAAVWREGTLRPVASFLPWAYLLLYLFCRQADPSALRWGPGGVVTPPPPLLIPAPSPEHHPPPFVFGWMWLVPHMTKREGLNKG